MFARNLALVVAVLLLIPACAGAPAHIRRVSYERDVNGCTRLSVQTTHRGLGGFFMGVSKRAALNEAERRAEAEGATHALTVESRANYFTGGRAVVVGFHCPE